MMIPVNLPAEIHFGRGIRSRLVKALPPGPVLFIAGKHSRSRIETEVIPLLEGREFRLFSGVSPEPPLEEVEQAATLVQQAVHPDALTIFGAAFDETLDDEIRVTVIATGFDEAQQAANAAAVTQPAQTENSGAPQPLDEVKGEQGQDEMDKSFDEILRIFNKDKF